MSAMLTSRHAPAHRWSLPSDMRHGLAPGHMNTVALQTRRHTRMDAKQSEGEPAPKATDEQLLRQLNSSHLWLPDENDDFGLDDVAAHVAARNQAQRVAFSANNKKGKSRKANKMRAPPSTLAQLDPDSGDVPKWVEELRAEGFDVLGRNGELFLQRGEVQQEQSFSSNSRGLGGKAAEADKNRAGSHNKQQQQQRAPVPAVPVSEKSLAVRLEFDPLVWQQQQHQTDSKHDDFSNSHPHDAWYAQCSGSSSNTGTGMGNRTPAAASTSSSQDQAAAKSKRNNVQRQLLGFKHPEQLLGFIEGCFPAWSANGCWLLDQQHAGVVPAPTPAEAAAALKGVALAAKRAAFNPVQTQSLARDRRVLGLIECLRLTPPRTPPHQDLSIVKRLWSIAKAYWLQAGTTAIAAQQQLLAATQPPAAQAASKGQLPQQLRNGTAAGDVPSLGPLLVQLQSAGLKLNRQQLAAAQSLIASRQEDQLRQQAWVNALWGMAAIGGPLFFEQDMEALCQVAGAALSRWKLTPFELSDALWALATSRHWSPLLPQLEASLLAAGGVEACTAPELITALWAFASLSYQPKQLLAQFNSKGWCVKPMSALPGAQRSSSSQPTQSAQSRNQQKKQLKQKPLLQQQQQPAAPQGTGDSSAHSRIPELSSGQLSALVWSLACLQHVDSGLFKLAWVEVCRRGMGMAGDVRQLVRVHQAALAVELEASYKPTELYCDEGTRQLLETAAKTFKQESSGLQSKVHSTYQRSIATTLARMRVMHILEDNSTGYSVDIAVPSIRLAIEADGPSHMSRTKSRQGRVMLGATAMKRRHLQGLGWSVLNVGYTDWEALTSEQQRMAYLKKQVAAAIATRQQAA